MATGDDGRAQDPFGFPILIASYFIIDALKAGEPSVICGITPVIIDDEGVGKVFVANRFSTPVHLPSVALAHAAVTDKATVSAIF